MANWYHPFYLQGCGLTPAQQLQLDRVDFLCKVFINRAVTTPQLDGSKIITFYDDDDITILDQLTISADGLVRTNAP